MKNNLTNKDYEYFSLCGIKGKWQESSFKDFVNCEPAKDRVLHYLGKLKEAQEDGVGLYLWGANGTGKSMLMNLAFKEIIITHRKSVRIFSMDQLVSFFTDSWYSSEARHELRDVLLKVDFLGIDEFGENLKKGGTDYLPDVVKNALESILQVRIQSGKPTWIASNTEPKYVKDIFSEDVASLLKEACLPVQVTGTDYRGVKGEELRTKYLGE